MPAAPARRPDPGGGGDQAPEIAGVAGGPPATPPRGAGPEGAVRAAPHVYDLVQPRPVGWPDTLHAVTGRERADRAARGIEHHVEGAGLRLEHRAVIPRRVRWALTFRERHVAQRGDVPRQGQRRPVGQIHRRPLPAIEREPPRRALGDVHHVAPRPARGVEDDTACAPPPPPPPTPATTRSPASPAPPRP